MVHIVVVAHLTPRGPFRSQVHDSCASSSWIPHSYDNYLNLVFITDSQFTSPPSCIYREVAISSFLCERRFEKRVDALSIKKRSGCSSFEGAELRESKMSAESRTLAPETPKRPMYFQARITRISYTLGKSFNPSFSLNRQHGKVRSICCFAVRHPNTLSSKYIIMA